MTTQIAYVPTPDALVQIPVPEARRAGRHQAAAAACQWAEKTAQYRDSAERAGRYRDSKVAVRALRGEFGDREKSPVGGLTLRPRLLPRPLPAGTWYRPGFVRPYALLSLTRRAVTEYAAATGHQLPWKLSWSFPGASGYKGQEPDDGQLDRVARLAGWLRSAAIGPFPMLRRLIAKTASVRGVNSPYTTVKVWDLASHTRSPGAAERLLCKVRQRANQLLEPYGVSVSWTGLAAALEKGDRRVGKAARKAVRETLRGLLNRRFGLYLTPASGSGLCRLDGGYHYSDPPARRDELVDPLMVARGLKAALAAEPRVRQWVGDRIAAGEFADLRSALAAAQRLVLDHSDGVEVLLDTAQAVSAGGCLVVPGHQTYRARTSRGTFRPATGRCCLVRSPSGRTYHSRGNYLADGPQGLVREAVAAWRRQDEAMAANMELVGNDQYSVLVRPDHSYAAGNCRPGTEAWMARYGLTARRIVPARDLLPLLDTDHRVRGALVVAAGEAAAQAST